MVPRPWGPGALDTPGRAVGLLPQSHAECLPTPRVRTHCGGPRPRLGCLSQGSPGQCSCRRQDWPGVGGLPFPQEPPDLRGHRARPAPAAYSPGTGAHKPATHVGSGVSVLAWVWGDPEVIVTGGDGGQSPQIHTHSSA